jgi:hypothetical protein
MDTKHTLGWLIEVEKLIAYLVRVVLLCLLVLLAWASIQAIGQPPSVHVWSNEQGGRFAVAFIVLALLVSKYWKIN